MMFGLRSRACAVCGDTATKHNRLTIYKSKTKSSHKRSWPVCSYCASPVVFAARYEGLHSRDHAPVVDLIASTESAARSKGSSEGGPPATSPVATAISLVSVLVIVAFGALATFGSSFYFLGAIVPFIPLGLVAWRAGDHRRPEPDSHDAP